jgi:chromosome segregation ATPase
MSVPAALPQYSGNQNLKAEVDKVAAAVENAEEELKEWKSGNKQEEAQLRQVLASLLAYHEQFKSMSSDLQHKIAGLARQQEALEQAHHTHEAVTATGLMTQVRSWACLCEPF